MQESMQAARSMAPSREAARWVTGTCSASVKRRPILMSYRRTPPSTLAAATSARPPAVLVVTLVTLSDASVITCTGSNERERQSQTLTAWS